MIYQTKPTEVSTKAERLLKKGTALDDGTFQGYRYYQPEINGFAVYTVSNLPEGITYQEVEDTNQSNYLLFSGVFMETGNWETKIDVIDEFGNKIHHTLVWKIYDEQTIVTRDITRYACLKFPSSSKPNGTYTSTYDVQLYPYGGSGAYTYEVVSQSDCMKLATKDGRRFCSINTDQVGDYTMKIKISDSNDPTIFTYTTVTFVIKQGIRLQVTSVDLDGNKIKYTSEKPYSCNIQSQWEDNSYSEVSISYEIGAIGREDGVVSCYVPEGIYDIAIQDNRNGTVAAYASDCHVSAATKEYQFVLPVYQQTIVSDNPAFTDLNKMGKWKDADGVVQGAGKYLYLPVGKYTLTSSSEIDGVTYQATLQISVTDTTRSATVTAHVVKSE